MKKILFKIPFLYEHSITIERLSPIDQKIMEEIKKMKITRADGWLDPLCCPEGKYFLEKYKTTLEAWDACTRPDFICWALDFMRPRIGAAIIGFQADPYSPVTQTPYRRILIKTFLQHQLKLNPWLVNSLMRWSAKHEWWAKTLFYLEVGYFDCARADSNEPPPIWWEPCAKAIKLLYQDVRPFLSEEK